MKRVLAFVPLILVVILGGFFLWGLKPDRDPNAIPSVLVSNPVPEFALGAVQGMDTIGLKTADLQNRPGLAAVNFFASWCVPCRAEHAVLDEISKTQDVALLGINYKDKPQDAAKWLGALGNIYSQIGADETGRVAIEWGVSGVPETFLIRDGVVVYRHLGPVVGPTARRAFEAAIEEARQ